MDFGNLVTRAVNIARFDIPTFEQVEHDKSLTQEAGTVVGIIAVVGSLGALFRGNLWRFIAMMVVGLIGWYVWSWLSAFIAQKVFKSETTDTGEMLRVTGYAHGPQILGIIPFPLIRLVGMLWSLVAVVIGMRQAGDFSTGKAVLTALIGWIPYAIAMGIVTSILF